MEKMQKFIHAIQEKRIVKVKVDTREKGIIERRCIPFDYGPSSKSKEKSDKYHLFTLDSPGDSHVLSILPIQLLSIELENENFNPGDYISSKTNWHIERDWGEYS